VIATALRARLLALGAITACAVLAMSIAACRHDPASETLPGVRLGMAPRDVRDRFEGGADGSWQTKVGGGAGASDDTVVEWSAGSDRSRVSHARFEFHLGMLVAVRAHLRDGGAQPEARIEATPKTVTMLTPAGGGTDVTMLARDCPTHREEAESLAAKAR
jgi:hypothetical protein